LGRSIQITAALGIAHPVVPKDVAVVPEFWDDGRGAHFVMMQTKLIAYN
jgi:hypothetical protein